MTGSHPVWGHKMPTLVTSAFTRAAWLFLGYLVAVILFGAWVRISHSGAGCGSSWPTCHGEIVPSLPSTAAVIEFTHRLSSGLCGIFGLVMLGWAWRRFQTGQVFRLIALTLLFIVFEGAIGAGLVLGELVADDDSVARAIVIALHLINTLALTACAALAAWHSQTSLRGVFITRRRLVFVVGLALVVVTVMSGAVTALGDTLFPIEVTTGTGLFTQIRDDLSAGNHFLVRLRVLHPLMAIVMAAYMLWLLLSEATTNRWASVALYLIVLEVVIGFLNIGLAAPALLQIIHLLIAQAFWVSIVLTFTSSGRDETDLRNSHDGGKRNTSV